MTLSDMLQLGEELRDWLSLTNDQPGSEEVPNADQESGSADQKRWYLIQFQLCTLGFSLALSLTWIGCSEMCIINRTLNLSPVHTSRSRLFAMLEEFITRYIIGTINVIARTVLPSVFFVPVSCGKAEKEKSSGISTGQSCHLQAIARRSQGLIQPTKDQSSCKLTAALSTAESWVAKLKSTSSSLNSCSCSSRVRCSSRSTSSLLRRYRQPTAGNLQRPAFKISSQKHTDPIRHMVDKEVTYANGKLRTLSSGNVTVFSDRDSKTTVIVSGTGKIDSINIVRGIRSNSPYTPPIRYIDIDHTGAPILLTNSKVETKDRVDCRRFKPVCRSNFISQQHEPDCEGLDTQISGLFTPDIDDVTSDLISGDFSLIVNKYISMDDMQTKNICVLYKQKDIKEKEEVDYKQKERINGKQKERINEKQKEKIQRKQKDQMNDKQKETKDYKEEKHANYKQGQGGYGKQKVIPRQSHAVLKSRSNHMLSGPTNDMKYSNRKTVTSTRTSNLCRTILWKNRKRPVIVQKDVVTSLQKNVCIDSFQVQRNLSCRKNSVQKNHFQFKAKKLSSKLHDERVTRMQGKEQKSPKMLTKKCVNRKQINDLHTKSTTRYSPLNKLPREVLRPVSSSIKLNRDTMPSKQGRYLEAHSLHQMPRRLPGTPRRLGKIQNKSHDKPQLMQKVPKTLVEMPHKLQNMHQSLQKSPKKLPESSKSVLQSSGKLFKVHLNAKKKGPQRNYSKHDVWTRSNSQPIRNPEVTAHQQPLRHSTTLFFNNLNDASAVLSGFYDKNDRIQTDLKGPMRSKSHVHKFRPYDITQRLHNRKSDPNVNTIKKLADKERPQGSYISTSAHYFELEKQPCCQKSCHLVQSTTKRDAQVSTSAENEQEIPLKASDAVTLLSILLHLPKFLQEQVLRTANKDMDVPPSEIFWHPELSGVEKYKSKNSATTTEECVGDKLTVNPSDDSMFCEGKQKSLSKMRLSTTTIVDMQPETSVGKSMEQNMNDQISKQSMHVLASPMSEFEFCKDSSSYTTNKILLPRQEYCLSVPKETDPESFHNRMQNETDEMHDGRFQRKLVPVLSTSNQRESDNCLVVEAAQKSISCIGKLHRRKLHESETDIEMKSISTNQPEPAMTNVKLFSQEAEKLSNRFVKEQVGLIRRSRIPVLIKTSSQPMKYEQQFRNKQETTDFQKVTTLNARVEDDNTKVVRVNRNVEFPQPAMRDSDVTVSKKIKSKTKYRVMMSRFSKDKEHESRVFGPVNRRDQKLHSRQGSGNRTILPHNRTIPYITVSKKCKHGTEFLRSLHSPIKLEVTPGIRQGKLCPTLAHNNVVGSSDNLNYVPPRRQISRPTAKTESGNQVTAGIAPKNRQVLPFSDNRDKTENMYRSDEEVNFARECQKQSFKEISTKTENKQLATEVNRSSEMTHCTDQHWLSPASDKPLLLSLERLKCSLREIRHQINGSPFGIYAKGRENFDEYSQGQGTFQNLSNLSEKLDNILFVEDLASQVDASFREVSECYNTRNMSRTRNMLNSDSNVKVAETKKQAEESGFTPAVENIDVFQDSDNISCTKRGLPQNVQSELSCVRARKFGQICDNFQHKRFKPRTGMEDKGSPPGKISFELSSYKPSLTSHTARSERESSLAPGDSIDFSYVNPTCIENCSFNLHKPMLDSNISSTHLIRSESGATHLSPFSLSQTGTHSPLSLSHTSTQSPFSLSHTSTHYGKRNRDGNSCQLRIRKANSSTEHADTMDRNDTPCERFDIQNEKAQEVFEIKFGNERKSKADIQMCGGRRKLAVHSEKRSNILEEKEWFPQVDNYSVGRNSIRDPQESAQGNQRTNSTSMLSTKGCPYKSKNEIRNTKLTNENEITDKAQQPNALNKITRKAAALSRSSCYGNCVYQMQNSNHYLAFQREKKGSYHNQITEKTKSKLNAQKYRSHNCIRHKERTEQLYPDHNSLSSDLPVKDEATRQLDSSLTERNVHPSSSSKLNTWGDPLQNHQKDDVQSTSSRDSRSIFRQELSICSNSSNCAATSSPPFVEQLGSPTFHFTEIDCSDQTNCRRTKLVRKIPEDILFSSAARGSRPKRDKIHCLNSQDNKKMCRSKKRSAGGRASAVGLERHHNTENVTFLGHNDLQCPQEKMQHYDHVFKQLSEVGTSNSPHLSHTCKIPGYTREKMGMLTACGGMTDTEMSEMKLASMNIQSDLALNRTTRLSLNASSCKTNNMDVHRCNCRDYCQELSSPNSDTFDNHKVSVYTSSSIPSPTDRDSCVKNLRLSGSSMEHIQPDPSKSSVPGLHTSQADSRQQEDPKNRKKNVTERDQLLEMYRQGCSDQSEHVNKILSGKQTNAATDAKVVIENPQRGNQDKNNGRCGYDTPSVNPDGRGYILLDPILRDVRSIAKTHFPWTHAKLSSLATMPKLYNDHHRQLMTTKRTEDCEYSELEHSKISIISSVTGFQHGCGSSSMPLTSDNGFSDHKESSFLQEHLSEPQYKTWAHPNSLVNMDTNGHQCLDTDWTANGAKYSPQVYIHEWMPGEREDIPKQDTFSNTLELMGNSGEYNSREITPAGSKSGVAQICKRTQSLDKVASSLDHNKQINTLPKRHKLHFDNKMHQEKLPGNAKKFPYLKKTKSETNMTSSKSLRRVSSNFRLRNIYHASKPKFEALGKCEQLRTSNTHHKPPYLQTNRISHIQNIRKNKSVAEQVKPGVKKKQVISGTSEGNISRKHSPGNRSTNKSDRLKLSRLAWSGVLKGQNNLFRGITVHRERRSGISGSRFPMDTRSNKFCRPSKSISSKVRHSIYQSETPVKDSQVVPLSGLFSLKNGRTKQSKSFIMQNKRKTVNSEHATHPKSSSAQHDHETIATIKSTATNGVYSMNDHELLDSFSNDVALSAEKSVFQSNIILSANSPKRSHAFLTTGAQLQQEKCDSTERNEVPASSSAATNMENYMRNSKFTPEWGNRTPSSAITTYQPRGKIVQNDSFITQASTMLRHSAASINISLSNSHSESPAAMMPLHSFSQQKFTSSSLERSSAIKIQCVSQDSVPCQTVTQEEAVHASNSIQTRNFCHKNPVSKFSYFFNEPQEVDSIKEEPSATFLLGGKRFQNLKIKPPKEDTFVGKIVKMFEKKFTFIPPCDGLGPSTDRAGD